jgi:hypothetical protein
MGTVCTVALIVIGAAGTLAVDTRRAERASWRRPGPLADARAAMKMRRKERLMYGASIGTLLAGHLWLLSLVVMARGINF